MTLGVPKPRQRGVSLRVTLLGLSVGALAYIALVGIDVGFRIGPDAARIGAQSGAALTEFQESRRRSEVLDVAMTDLWRLLGQARREPVVLDTLEAIRIRLQDMEDSPRQLSRVFGDLTAPPALAEALAQASRREGVLAGAMFAAIAALETRNVTAAERMLRRADSLDAPLAEALADATSSALQQVRDHEEALVAAARGTTRILWLWLGAGVLVVSLLAFFLHRRLYAPLSAIDAGFRRVAAGDLGVTLIARHDDELGRLSQHFNRMTGVLRQRAADESKRTDETAARTRLMLDSTLDAIIVMDSQGIIREWNPRAEAIFGWPREEVIGGTIGEEMLPPEFRAAYLDGLRQGSLAETLGVLNRRVETVARRKDGSTFEVEVAIVPLRSGNEMELSAFVRDISDRRAAEVALTESETRYRAAFEQAAVGMAETGLDSRYIRVNSAFARMVGREVDDFAGLAYADITHPDDIEGDVQGLSDLINGRTMLVRREKRYMRKDGTYVWAMLNAAVVRDAEGKPSYALSVVQDLTERKRLEGELHQVQKMEAVGRLAGGIAHDFNNLLSGIMGYADLLQHAEGSTSEVREDARAIIATAQQGADLAQNLLTLARRSPQRSDRVNLHDVVREVQKLVARTFDRSIEITTKIESDSLVVLGDRSQLTNALLNLAINAKDAMPAGGGLTFSARLVDLDDAACSRLSMSATPGRYVVMSVQDTGTGMSPETRARIFEPFFTTKTVGKGTGLGLAMVYGTVGSHNGMIDVETTIGTGSTFSIYLPSREDLAVAAGQASGAVVSGGGRVLVADDEATVREVVGRMLERIGYEVDVVVDGEKAVSCIRDTPHKYVAAILDGDMPRMNGRDAARLIRRIDPELPLLFASGNIDAVAAKELESIGFKAAIGKPYTLAELSQTMAANARTGANGGANGASL